MLEPLRHAHTTPQRPERVVVLGARGFVGTALARELARLDIPMLALSSTDVDLAHPKAGMSLADRLRADDVIVFLSALKSGRALDQTARDANLAMARAVCEGVAASSCQHVVYLSSDSAYPFQDDAITEATAAVSTSLYSGMHLAREAMLGRLDAAVAVLRATQVYGYGDTHNAYGPNRMSRSALTEGRIMLFGEGEDTRDHIYIADLVGAIVEVLQRKSYGLLNVAAGESASFADIARIIARLCPHPIVIQHAERRMPVLHRRFQVAALRRALPDPRPTSLSEGISLLLEASRGASIDRDLATAGS